MDLLEEVNSDIVEERRFAVVDEFIEIDFVVFWVGDESGGWLFSNITILVIKTYHILI